MKPFECVGTREEVKLAAHMCRKMYEEHGGVGGEGKVPNLLCIMEVMGDREVQEVMVMLDDHNPRHLLPTWFTETPPETWKVL